MFPQLCTFLEFTHTLFAPDCKNLLDITFYVSVLRISIQVNKLC